MKVRLMTLALAGCFVVWVGASGSATFQEDFASDPAVRGWRVFGDADLFHWNAANQHLEVTWDSSRSNSFFHHRLDTILNRTDDFSLAFDLRLSDVAIGVNTNKPFTFQVAIGLINLSSATGTNFLRGTGVDSPNLVEFDYFPDSGFGATIAPTLISITNQFNHGGFTFPLALTTDALFHIVMTYSASNQSLSTLMTSNGVPFGPINDATLYPEFGDFRVDTVAVSSYSDAGQDPQFGGSILAHGVVDNITWTMPAPPIAAFTGTFTNQVWTVDFLSRTNWIYTLEHTADFQTWLPSGFATPGNETNLFWHDTNRPASRVFYRIKAERP